MPLLWPRHQQAGRTKMTMDEHSSQKCCTEAIRSSGFAFDNEGLAFDNGLIQACNPATVKHKKEDLKVHAVKRHTRAKPRA